ncbi:DUF99 family protein [Candidatus Bathyarchaeota archaeon]|nr:DUF99 family protein [Candidatus Bathyarchaeota archaeon]
MSVIGVEDGSFQKGVTKTAILAVVLLKEAKIEKVKIKRIAVDGSDATEKLVEALKELSFSAVFLAGISFAGFNVIDPVVIHETFKKPVIVVSRTRPNNITVRRALQRHFDDWKQRWEVFKKIGRVYRILVVAKELPIYVETVGINIKQAQNIVRSLVFCSRVPEPIRVARLIARGLS